MNKLENKYIDAYHVIFKEGNLNGEWCINDVNAVSKIAQTLLMELLPLHMNKILMKKLNL